MGWVESLCHVVFHSGVRGEGARRASSVVSMAPSGVGCQTETVERSLRLDICSSSLYASEG